MFTKNYLEIFWQGSSEETLFTKNMWRTISTKKRLSRDIFLAKKKSTKESLNKNIFQTNSEGNLYQRAFEETCLQKGSLKGNLYQISLKRNLSQKNISNNFSTKHYLKILPRKLWRDILCQQKLKRNLYQKTSRDISLQKKSEEKSPRKNIWREISTNKRRNFPTKKINKHTLLRVIPTMTFQNSHVRLYVSLVVSGEGRHRTHLLKCVRLLSTSQTDWRPFSDSLSDISFDSLSDISSDIVSDIFSGISPDVLSGILSDISSDILSDISCDVLFDISNILSDIFSGIFCAKCLLNIYQLRVKLWSSYVIKLSWVMLSYVKLC